MNNDEAIAFANAALKHWDLPDCTPRLISNRENAVFEVVSADGGSAALRLHRPGYQTDEAIRSELIWSKGLDKAGMKLPRPIPAKNGDLIAKVNQAGRIASIVTWVEGVPLGDDGIADQWDEEMQLRIFSALGSELAQLHKLSDTLDLDDDFERERLDIDGLLGDNPNWGRFWENPTLTRPNRELLLDTRDRLRGIFEAYQRGGADFGLIHADALSENVLAVGETVTLIDFDDGGYGFRMYDLGVAMSQVWHRPRAGKLAAALAKGYDLSAREARIIPLFTVTRTLASCGWAISRYAADDPAMAIYADGAVRAASCFMSGRPLFAGS